jgi:hypothetical protein
MPVSCWFLLECSADSHSTADGRSAAPRQAGVLEERTQHGCRHNSKNVACDDRCAPNVPPSAQGRLCLGVRVGVPHLKYLGELWDKQHQVVRAAT